MLLTGLKEASHPQVAERDSHHRSFVQVGGHLPGEWKIVGKFIKHLSLLTPPTSGRITGAHFPLLGTGPGGGER